MTFKLFFWPVGGRLCDPSTARVSPPTSSEICLLLPAGKVSKQRLRKFFKAVLPTGAFFLETGLTCYARDSLAALAGLAIIATTGCQMVSRLPAANLEEPGWTVRQGQAVWRRERGAPEITGEILVAWREERAFVQFSKPPFPLVTAQKTARAWELELPAQNQRYSGRGKPPHRLVLLYLPTILAGRPAPPGWTWQTLDQGGWRLHNRKTGQSLEGYFAE